MHDLPLLPILAFWAVTGGIVYAAKSVARPSKVDAAEQRSDTAFISLVFGKEVAKKYAKAFPSAKKNGSGKRALSGAGASGDDASKVNSCQQFMQCALDQRAQADSAAARANSGNKDARLSAASEAQYHASAAREWADRAASTAYGASSLAQEAANRARDAANRAQEAANKARYNADTAR